MYIDTKTTPPKRPITVQPVQERIAYDIAIPKTSATLHRSYTRIETFDPSKVEPLFEPDATKTRYDLRVRVEDAVFDVELDRFSIERPEGPLASEIIAVIVKKTEAAAHLADQFATLYPLIEAYLAQRCFGGPVDLDADTVRAFLADPVNQNRIAGYLGRRLGDLTTEQRPLEVESAPILLSKTGLVAATAGELEIARERLFAELQRRFYPGGEAFVEQILSLHDKVLDYVRARPGLEIGQAAGRPLIIGDNPAATYDSSRRTAGTRDGVTITSANALVMPVTPAHVLAIGGRNRFVQLADKDVDLFNQIQIVCAVDSGYMPPSAAELEAWVLSEREVFMDGGQAATGN